VQIGQSVWQLQPKILFSNMASVRYIGFLKKFLTIFCLRPNMLHHTKFHQNQIIFHRNMANMAILWFSKWRSTII